MNVYPDASHLVDAYLDVLRHFNWKRFCVVYADESGEKQAYVVQVADVSYIRS